MCCVMLEFSTSASPPPSGAANLAAVSKGAAAPAPLYGASTLARDIITGRRAHGHAAEDSTDEVHPGCMIRDGLHADKRPRALLAVSGRPRGQPARSHGAALLGRMSPRPSRRFDCLPRLRLVYLLYQGGAQANWRRAARTPGRTRRRVGVADDIPGRRGCSRNTRAPSFTKTRLASEIRRGCGSGRAWDDRESTV